MSYLDIYKKRMGYDKSQTLNYRQDINKRYANDNFTITQGYKKATLIETLGFDNIDIDIITSSLTTELEKNIFFRPNQKVKVGSYICYDEKTFILREIDYDQLLPKSKGYLCNQIIRIKEYNIDVPCYTNSTTYGSKGILDQNKFYELDSKTRIYIQNNEYTKALKIGQRVMFSNKYVYKITELDDMVFPGMFIGVAIKDEILPMDNLEENLAYNEHNESNNIVISPMEGEIIGEEKIKINQESIYTIDIQEGTWSVDEEDLVSIEPSANSVKLIGLKVGWVALSYIVDDKVIDTFDIFIMK